MRITQSMVMNSYTNRLGKVFANMDYATQRVATNGRKFLSASEDPASAARGYQLRSSFQQTNDWLSNVQDRLDSMDSIDASIRDLVQMASHAHSEITLRAKNDTWAQEDRQIFANELRKMQENAVAALNAKFDDKFLFGGSSTKKLPFEFDPKKNELKFRGISVTTADPKEQAQLTAWANEKIYIDIGFGLSVLDPATNPDPVKEYSAFNISNPGIALLCNWNDSSVKTSDPTNHFILNLGILADLIETEPFLQDSLGGLEGTEITTYTKKLMAQHQHLLLGVTKIGADANFLETRRSVLERNSDDINKKLLSVEFVDMEEAIMDMKMTDYIYRAMLEMGARILQPSFIDFMR